MKCPIDDLDGMDFYFRLNQIFGRLSSKTTSRRV